MTYSAVWTVDHHPSLCGTAKFSHQLAERLGVPCVPFWTSPGYVLVSTRASEAPFTDRLPARFDLFLHDYVETPSAFAWILGATRLYAANRVIADALRTLRPDVVTLWAPSTMHGNSSRGALNMLTFGMAHKIQIPRYRKLRDLLERQNLDFTVSVSTAVHEGSPWDETAKVGDRLREVFGARLRVLGYLADDAMARELNECSAVAVFFDPALRENNTSFWAAYDSRQLVITNTDAHSPKVLGGTVFDIDQLDEWPTAGAFKPYQGASWDWLLVKLRTGASVVPAESVHA